MNPAPQQNDEVFAILRNASELYDRYVELARLGAAAALAELGATTELGTAELCAAEMGSGAGHPDLSHPLGLVIDTSARDQY